MEYQKKGETYIIRIDKGERVLETLTAWCEEHGFHTGFFRGIGAVEALSCGYYALADKQYHFTQYEGLFEVLSMTGNVALKENKPFLHVHGVFSGTDNTAFGGHVEEMTVGVVLEVVFQPLAINIDRTYDNEIGLFLMDLCGEREVGGDKGSD